MKNWILRWNNLTLREQWAISLAVVLLVIATVILGVVQPALRGIRDLNQRLPLLAAQKAQVEMLSSTFSKTVQPLSPSRQALLQMATSLNLAAEITGEGPFTLNFQAASFSTVMQMATQSKRSFALNVREAKFERLPAGTVSGQLVLAR